jgi:CubicO group peptidase (beta-lactamase class C family)
VSNSNFYDIKSDGTLEVMAGCDIMSTIREAIHLSFRGKKTIVFEFNDVLVTVEADSDPELIYRDWNRALNGYIGKDVGPYPKAVLSEEELLSDGRIKAENQARRDARDAEYAAKARAHRERVEALMADAPPMEFSDEAGWLNAKKINGDDYGAGILSYAERWARMMQLEMSRGKTLEEVWSNTSHEADLEGMSGATQGIATHLLTLTWVHGAELRRLHNAYWGSDATEGTVNPAILTSGGSNE